MSLTRTTKQDGITILSLTRGKVNAFNEEMVERDPVAFLSIKTLLRQSVVSEIEKNETVSIKRFVEIWYSPSTREQAKGIVIRG